MLINKLEKSHFDDVIQMMRDFYSSSAVLTNGSEEIFTYDIENCINNNPYIEGYVFIENNSIVGYGMVAKSFSTEFGKQCIWIEDIYLKPEYRKRGLGSQFLNFIENKYPNSLLRLEAEKENEQAIKAYKKNGFEILPYIELKKFTAQVLDK